MHPVITWTAGGAGVFGAAIAALLTHQIDLRRLRPQLAAMREHLASCTKRVTAGPYDQTADSASHRDIVGGLAVLDERRRQIADANPSLAAVLADIEFQAAWIAAACLAEETEEP